eukprot:45374-Eustigmatos_ZCMA.PRE.1
MRLEAIKGHNRIHRTEILEGHSGVNRVADARIALHEPSLGWGRAPRPEGQAPRHPLAPLPRSARPQQ